LRRQQSTAANLLTRDEAAHRREHRQEMNALGHSKNTDSAPLMVSGWTQAWHWYLALPAFGGFGRLLREGTHGVRLSVLLVRVDRA